MTFTPEEFALAKMPNQHGKVKQLADRQYLKPWQTIAILRRALYKEPFQKLVDDLNKGRGARYIERLYYEAPIAKKIRSMAREIQDDPEKLARFAIRANLPNFTMDWLLALEWAKEVKDFKAVHAMVKDLVNIGGIEVRGEQSAPEIHIHFADGVTLDLPEIKTTYQTLPSEIVSDDRPEDRS